MRWITQDFELLCVMHCVIFYRWITQDLCCVKNLRYFIKFRIFLRTPPFRVGNCAFCLDRNSTSVILGYQCRHKCTPAHKFSELKIQSISDKPPFWPIFRSQKMPQNRRIAYLFTPKMGGSLRKKLSYSKILEIFWPKLRVCVIILRYFGNRSV